MSIISKEKNELNFVATGDSMITMRLSHYTEKRYIEMVKILRDADIAFTNLEGMIHDFEGYSYKPWYHGTPMRAPPYSAEEIKWMGFNLVATANNHSMEYSEESMHAMFRHLDAANVYHAGMGKDLADARKPVYIWTEKGRVGLISASTAPAPAYTMADYAAPGIRGRPGMNGIRYSTLYVVDSDTMKKLKNISSLLKIKSPVQDYNETPLKKNIGEDEFLFVDKRFKVGDKPGIYSTANDKDIDANLREIRSAKKQADFVLMSFHCHEVSHNNAPVPFVRKFVQDCVDAGADAVLSHGHHSGLGIEIYKGKPIFHSLGTFIMQTSFLSRVPADSFEKYGLDPITATMADWNDARWRLWKFLSDPWNYKAVMAWFTISGGELIELKLYPIDAHVEKILWQRGRPMLADEKVGREIIDRYKRLSAPFGTEIEYKNGIGIVNL